MEKQDLDKMLNIGIPCYNHTFLKLRNITDCYLRGEGNKVINKERELRCEGLKLINKNTDLNLSVYDDNMFRYLSFGANSHDSVSSFGISKTSELASLFYNKIRTPICSVNDLNIEKIIDNIMKKETDEKLIELYKIRDILMNSDFKELENDYYKYLNTNLVMNKILEIISYKVSYLAEKKRYDLAQNYLFYLSAFLKVYGNKNIKIRSSYIELKDFINYVTNKYHLKDEFLLREGFINKSKEYGDRIINSINNKKDIKILGTLCVSGYRDIDKNKPSKESKERKKCELVEIKKILNDRRMFYLEHDPLVEFRPNGVFGKYGAFVYPNGIIVADRLYEVNSIDNLSEDAIYKFNSLNFEERKRMSKTELTKIPNSKFYHTNTWKIRTSDYINSKTTDEMKQKVKELINGEIK